MPSVFIGWEILINNQINNTDQDVLVIDLKLSNEWLYKSMNNLNVAST